MDSGQEMVVWIVGLVMAAGIIKAIFGIDDSGSKTKCKKRDNKASVESEELLIKMNDQLDRITARLSALETIVTDEDRELKREFSDLKSDVSKARKSFDSERY